MMAEAKFKSGDVCKIVNYGHLLWSFEPLAFFPLYAKGKSDKDPDWYDIRKDWIGQTVTIQSAKELQGQWHYATDLFSWANEGQLQLIK